jgi:hypothetical protein
VESESVSLRSWPLIEERDLHFFILRCSVVGSLFLPSEMGITWESLGNHMGLKTLLFPLQRGKAFGRWKSPYAGRFKGSVPVS